jgi:anti-sigma factor RsiW
MCELSTKLIAWVDGELPDGEAAEVERHIDTCRECCERIDRYKKVSGMLDSYCDATLAAQEPKRTMPAWVPALGAAAALAVLLAVFVRARIERSLAPASTSPVAAVASTLGASNSPEAVPAAVAPVVAAHRVHAVTSRKLRKPDVSVIARSESGSRETGWLPAGPAIEIAIPGEDIFPPGALPPGVGFVADVSIASDGSAQRVQLRPQLTGFEGGLK